MIKKSYVPFYQSLIWPLAENFSILLSNLLKKISIQEFYDAETTTARRNKKNKTLVDRKQLNLARFFNHKSLKSKFFSSSLQLQSYQSFSQKIKTSILFSIRHTILAWKTKQGNKRNATIQLDRIKLHPDTISKVVLLSQMNRGPYYYQGLE